MTLADLLTLLTPDENADIAALLKRLKGTTTLPPVADYLKQYSPAGHAVFDKAIRPDGWKQVTDPLDASKKSIMPVKVGRIGLALQRIITGRAVSFLFGNPPIVKCEPKTDQDKKVLFAHNRILHDNKIKSFNRKVARELFRSTQVAECWFTVEKDTAHTDYGLTKGTKFRLRSVDFSPWDGNELYPLFDDTGDLIAFSRQFERTDEESKKITYFETYTDTEKIVWIKKDSNWEQPVRTPNAIGKIPVVWASQDETEWAVVQTNIERLEYLLSNFADTNDYHAAPKIFVEGTIVGISDKGSSNSILQGTQGSKASYLSWNHATDAVKLEIETLLRFIYSFTQTPDISFESVKGMGQIASETLKMLFLDAHLKVQDKREVFDAYLQRRTNIIKAFIGVMDTSLAATASALEIECDIQPFIISDEKSLIDMLMVATAGEQILSQESAVKLSGLVDDTDGEVKRIQAEQEARQAVSITEPTI